MPTYDYMCKLCGNRFDAWQKMTDEPLSVCPKCAGHVHRVIHPTGILFKGAGFYSTDQRGAAAKPAPAEEAPAAAASAKSGDGAAEKSTPATPTPASTTPPTSATPTSGASKAAS